MGKIVKLIFMEMKPKIRMNKTEVCLLVKSFDRTQSLGVCIGFCFGVGFKLEKFYEAVPGVKAQQNYETFFKLK